MGWEIQWIQENNFKVKFMTSIIQKDSNNYKDFLISLKKDILWSQQQALKSVNTELLSLYWNIWKKLSDKIHTSWWWKSIVENLSKDLKKEFSWIQGFSKQNLWNMIKFYEFYSENKKLHPLAGEISWSNNIIILEKCENNFQREYYLKLSKKLAISKRVLQNKIESNEFERIISESKTNNFELTLEEENLQIVQNTIKEDYIFDFLTLWTEYKERDLETKLIRKLQDFILELWIGFAYIGNQYNIKLDWEDYFLDLLFYHTKLKSYIVIELKIWKFLPEYAGKLNFYLNIVDDTVKDISDNPTIWILICKEKNHEVVEYSLRWQTSPMAITEYSFDRLPKDYQNNLPDVKKIEKFLESF